jgi:hypothetical protein
MEQLALLFSQNIITEVKSSSCMGQQIIKESPAMYPMKKRSICPVLQFNFSIHSRAT